MKECNICDATCYPKKEILWSNMSCDNFKRDNFCFKFADHISRVTIKNSKNPALAWLMEWAR